MIGLVLEHLGDFLGEDSFESGDEDPESPELLNSAKVKWVCLLLAVDEALSKYETFGTLGLQDVQQSKTCVV